MPGVLKLQGRYQALKGAQKGVEEALEAKRGTSIAPEPRMYAGVESEGPAFEAAGLRFKAPKGILIPFRTGMARLLAGPAEGGGIGEVQVPSPPNIRGLLPPMRRGLGIGDQGTTGFATTDMWGRTEPQQPPISYDPFTNRATRKGLQLTSGEEPQTTLRSPRPNIAPPVGPLYPKQGGNKLYNGVGFMGERIKPTRISPVGVVGGSEPTPTGGARGFSTAPQPNVRFGGSVRGVPAEYPPFEGQYVGQEPPPRGPVVDALPQRLLPAAGSIQMTPFDD